MCVITFSNSIYRFKSIHTLEYATKIVNSTTADNASGGLFSAFIYLLGSVNPDFIMFFIEYSPSLIRSYSVLFASISHHTWKSVNC